MLRRDPTDQPFRVLYFGIGLVLGIPASQHRYPRDRHTLHLSSPLLIFLFQHPTECLHVHPAEKRSPDLYYVPIKSCHETLLRCTLRNPPLRRSGQGP